MSCRRSSSALSAGRWRAPPDARGRQQPPVDLADRAHGHRGDTPGHRVDVGQHLRRGDVLDIVAALLGDLDLQKPASADLKPFDTRGRNDSVRSRRASVGVRHDPVRRSVADRVLPTRHVSGDLALQQEGPALKLVGQVHPVRQDRRSRRGRPRSALDCQSRDSNLATGTFSIKERDKPEQWWLLITTTGGDRSAGPASTRSMHPPAPRGSHPGARGSPGLWPRRSPSVFRGRTTVRIGEGLTGLSDPYARRETSLTEALDRHGGALR